MILEELEPSRKQVAFHTRSGRLLVQRAASGGLTLDFPLWPASATSCEPPAALVEAVGPGVISAYSIPELHGAQCLPCVRPPLYRPPTCFLLFLCRVPPCESPAQALDRIAPLVFTGAPYFLFEYATPEEVQALSPDLGAMTANVCATALTDDPTTDFVSRWFGPCSGIPEDPVTGSAHCTLAPFWGARLGKSKMSAKQVSPRGGELEVALDGERVLISGKCALFMKGSLYVPDSA